MKELTLGQKMAVDGLKLALENIERLEKEIKKENDSYIMEYLLESHQNWVQCYNNYSQLYYGFDFSILNQIKQDWRNLIKELELNIEDFLASSEDIEIKKSIIFMMENDIEKKINKLEIQIDFISRLFRNIDFDFDLTDIANIKYVCSSMLDLFRFSNDQYFNLEYFHQRLKDGFYK